MMMTDEEIQMTEQQEEERVNKINKFSAQKMEEFLMMLEDNEIDMDEMLGIAYASMVVVSSMGFSSKNMAEDATKAAENLIQLLAENDGE
jgi:hypothetical protein